MNKYIPTEKLIAEINRRKELYHERGCGCDNAIEEELDDLLSFSTSLQQEQPEVGESEYGPYARQYPKSEVSKEQPEVDLEKEIGRTYHDGSVADTSDMGHVDYENIARHFYELGLNARKED